jgi:peptidoglycan hydrolase-like protein with peptidoglycan-binding domain
VDTQVQQDLAEAGYYRGPIDGVIGPMSRAAISSYQHDNGLAVTGAINGSLLQSMGID